MPDGSYAKYPKPRRLTTTEIPEIIQLYRQAAVNAISAGTKFLILDIYIFFYIPIWANNAELSCNI